MPPATSCATWWDAETDGYAFARFPMWPKVKAAANALPYDLTIMADTEILGTHARQVRIPVLVGAGAKSPEALKVAVRSFSSDLSISPLPFDR